MNIKDTVTSLAALAQESRLALFRLLVKRGPEGYAPGELAEKLEIPGPTLSFHLKELSRAGLIEARKESRYIYYSPNFDRVNELIDFLTENCCSLSASACPPNCAPAKTAARKPQAFRRRA